MRAKLFSGICAIAVVTSLVHLAAAGDISLAKAAKDGDAAAVRALLVKKADVNAAESDGTTPLHWAVYKDSLDMVDLLITAGANAKTVNRYGMTPLSLASTNGNTDIVVRLLKAGADANL